MRAKGLASSVHTHRVGFGRRLTNHKEARKERGFLSGRPRVAGSEADTAARLGEGSWQQGMSS